VTSILLYGAPIWAEDMGRTGRRAMAKAKRKVALRVASAYATVSNVAALVLASTLPIDLLAKERKDVYEARLLPFPERAEAKRKPRKDSLSPGRRQMERFPKRPLDIQTYKKRR